MRLRLIKIHARGRIIEMVCKREDGKRVIVRVSDFYPYFYSDTIPQGNDVIKVEKGYRSFDGKKLYKIFLIRPGLVPRYRKTDPETERILDYEADIVFVQRFLIDTGIMEFFEVPDSDADIIEVSVRDIKTEDEKHILNIIKE